VRYLNETLDKAANRGVQDLVKDGGIGGVIALDNHGNGEFFQ
jgi:beta-aspartyl-peptidase (threonine type)